MRRSRELNREFKLNLRFYNDLVSRFTEREKPFEDKQHAYLFLMFGKEWKKFAPSLNGRKPRRRKKP